MTFQFTKTHSYRSLFWISGSTESPWCKPFYTLKETNEFAYLDSPIVSGIRFVNSLWENKENDDFGWVLLASLQKLTKEKNEHPVK